jgi:tetratricopeptide (TPR) repeat protein
LVAFFWLFPKNGPVKYFVTIFGVLLAAAVPELASKQRRWIRVLLICIPAAGIAAVQIANDRENAETLNQLSEETIRKAQAHTRDMEMQNRDLLVQGTVDSLDNIQKADGGILRKADRLAVEVFLQESQLLVKYRELRRTIVLFGDNPEKRLDGYRRIFAQQPSPEIARVVRLQEAELAYRKMADIFVGDIKPQYEALRKQAGQLDSNELCGRMSAIGQSLRELLRSYSIAVVYNQLGSIALACGQKDEALGDFYTGLALDPAHIPLRESLGYALWIINQDSYSALNVASVALKIVEAEPGAADRQLAEAIRLREEIKKDDIELSAILQDSRTAELRKFARNWDEFVLTMKDRIVNQYAYFSALQVANRSRARELMKSLFERFPDDPEYQDTWGFVLMRFYGNEGDLDEAERLFGLAVRGRKPETTTYSLATSHLRQLKKFSEDLAARH